LGKSYCDHENHMAMLTRTVQTRLAGGSCRAQSCRTRLRVRIEIVLNCSTILRARPNYIHIPNHRCAIKRCTAYVRCAACRMMKAHRRHTGEWAMFCGTRTLGWGGEGDGSAAGWTEAVVERLPVEKEGDFSGLVGK
jgi:hypothetical protein